MMAITISAKQPRRAFMVQTSSVGGAQQNRRTDPTRTDQFFVAHRLTGSQGGAKPAFAAPRLCSIKGIGPEAQS
jgi:hypothetical protein